MWWFAQHKNKANGRHWYSPLWGRLCALSLLCVLLVGLTSAQERRFTEDEEAQARLQRGISLYQQAQYAAALAQIRFAHRDAPFPKQQEYCYGM